MKYEEPFKMLRLHELVLFSECLSLSIKKACKICEKILNEKFITCRIETKLVFFNSIRFTLSHGAVNSNFILHFEPFISILARTPPRSRIQFSKLIVIRSHFTEIQSCMKSFQSRLRKVSAQGSHQLKKKGNFVNKIHKTLTAPPVPLL